MIRRNKKLVLPPNSGTRHSVLVTLLTEGREGRAVSYADLKRGLKAEYGDDLSGSFGNIKQTVEYLNINFLRRVGIEAIKTHKSGSTRIYPEVKGFRIVRRGKEY